MGGRAIATAALGVSHSGFRIRGPWMTLTSRILRAVRRVPFRTATQIAHALNASPASVSGILCRARARVRVYTWDKSKSGGMQYVSIKLVHSLFADELMRVAGLTLPKPEPQYEFARTVLEGIGE